MPFLGARVKRTRRGDFELRLPENERSLLEALLPQLREVLTADAGAGADPQLRRLFPSAYPADAEQDAEYRGLVADDLLVRRLTAIDTVAATLADKRIGEEQLVGWMGAVNDLRLVLGTRLDVSEDMDLRPGADDPDGPALAVYTYLGYLLESIVDALSGSLPPPSSDEA